MPLTTLFIDILEVSGGIMIAYMVIKVHHRIKLEGKINKKVGSAMKRERLVAFTGIGCLMLSIFLRIITVVVAM